MTVSPPAPPALDGPARPGRHTPVRQAPVRALAAALFLVALLLGWLTAPAVPAAATGEESGSGSGSAGPEEVDEPDPDLTELLVLPPAVLRWFDSDGLTVARSGAPTVLAEEVGTRGAEVTVGTPRPVLAWSEELLAGSVEGLVVTTTGRVVAPVILDDEAVGVLVLDTSSGSYEGEVLDVPRLGPALVDLPPTVGVVHDPRTAAWYRYAHHRVAPLDERAAVLLAGSADIEDYLDFLLDPEPAAVTDDGGDRAVVWVVVLGVVLVGGLLLTAGLVVWLRGDEEEAEERPTTESLRARVRAELRNGRPGTWNHRG